MASKKAQKLLNYLLARAEQAGEKALDMLHGDVEAVEIYAKYGVALEDAEEFVFNVRRGNDNEIVIEYWPSNPGEFDRAVGLLKSMGLEEGGFLRETA